MKPLIMSLALAGVLLTACGPTTRTTTTDNAAYNVSVPENIRSSFSISYPDATNVSWNRYDVVEVPLDWEMSGWTVLDPNDYVVTWDQGKNRYYAWYDSEGALIGTAYAVNDYSTLPYAVNSLLQNSYRDYAIESVQREMKNDKVAYEIKLKKADDSRIKLLVDGEGKILKQKEK